MSVKRLVWRASVVWAPAACLVIQASAQWVEVDPFFPAGSGPNYYVQSLALQPDGRVLVGGEFTNFSSVSQSYLARLDTNGAVDVSFAPKLDGRPTSIQPLLDGRIFLFGNFTNVNGVARPGLARLLPDGALDPDFVPPTVFGSGGGTSSGFVAPDGSVFAVRTFFVQYAGPYYQLTHLLADGSVDPVFQSPFAPTNSISVVAVEPDGQPIISGTFSNVHGVAETNLVRLHQNGSVDTSFQSGLTSDERVSRALLLPNGSLLTLVSKVAFGIVTLPQQLVRLDPDGSVDSRFHVTFAGVGFPFPSAISVVALQPDEKILLGGFFLDVNGTPRARIARLESDGMLDYCYDVALSGDLNPFALAAEPDGGVLVGGVFAGLQGQSHPYLLRLLPATNCAPGVIQMAVPALTAREDETEVVVPVVRHGGADLEQAVAFSTRDGSARAGADYDAVSGTLHFAPGERSQSVRIPLIHDTSGDGPETFQVVLRQPGGGATLGALTHTTVALEDFPPGIAGAPDTNYVVQLDGPVQAILPLADGGAFIAGAFTNVDGQFCPSLARLQPDGSRDTNFVRASALDGNVESLALDAQGRPLVGGYFQHVDGVWQPGLARLETNGALDASFTPFNAWFTNGYAPQMAAVAVLPGGNIVCGGSVPSGTYTRSVLLKFSATGVLDETFTNQMSASANITSLFPLPDGDFYASGGGLGGPVVRLHEDGTLDFGFIPQADRVFQYNYGHIALLPDGRIMGASRYPHSSQDEPMMWRLNPDGSGDTGFSLPASSGPWGQLRSVDALDVSPDGRFLVAGGFSGSTNSAATLVRFRADGSWDLGFNQGGGLQPRPAYGYAAVNSLKILPTGGCLVGGDFAGYDGFSQAYLVKLLPERPSAQPLAFQFTVTNVTVTETNGLIALEIWRSGDASTPAGVTVRTQDGSAIGGLNYQPLDETLAFAPGEWNQTVTVNILDDRIADGNRQFTVELSDPTGGFTLAPPDVVTVEVQNVETGVTFTTNSFHAIQQDGFAIAAVQWSGVISTTLQAAVNIKPITGSASDLAISNVMVPCRAGVVSFRIPITDSTQHEPTREFQLSLAASGQVIAGPPAELLLDDLNYPTTPARGVAGVVEAMANAPGGGVYLAGDFMGVHGAPRIRVARLLPDGEVDADFNPGTGPNADVTALAVQPADGRVLIAGDFTAVDGVPRAGLARLNADGSLDASFDPGLGAQNANETPYPSPTYNQPPFINTLLPQNDGSVFVAGLFTGFNNQISDVIVKLKPNGAVDDSFVSPFFPTGKVVWQPYPIPQTNIVTRLAASEIAALVQQADDRFVAALAPPVYGGIGPIPTWPPQTAATRLVRFDSMGQLDSDFGTNSEILARRPTDSLTLSADGNILVGSSGATNRGWVAIQQFTTNGQFDATFQVRNVPLISFDLSDIRQLLVQPDGRILFSAVIYTNNAKLFPSLTTAVLDRAIIGRLLPDGAWDNSFQMVTCSLPLLSEQAGPFWFNSSTLFPMDSQSSRPVPTVSMALQPDGVLVLAGAFDSVNGQPRRRLARVNPDGSLRGRLILSLTAGHPMRLLLPPEVETPYVIQTSTDLHHWSDWLIDDYPWWPFALPLAPDAPTRFFRASPSNETFRPPERKWTRRSANEP